MEEIVSKQLLNAAQVQQKVRRLAYEIYEQNFTESALTIVGIEGNHGGQGWNFAQRLASVLQEISDLHIELIRIPVSVDNSITNWTDAEEAVTKVKDKVVIVTDDVLNTGRTLFYALTSFKDIYVKKVQVAVMVDRSHHHFPINADFVGYALSTTINEHVRVLLENEEGVYLK